MITGLRNIRRNGASADFWKFWTGQAISSLGDSFTGFALPLLVYQLTGSALNLAVSMAAYMLPYLLFGLIIGAWADRLDRKRLMIFVDLARAVVLATIPALNLAGALQAWWIYAVLFITSTLGIFFDSAEFAAIPSLVSGEQDLVTANGRIQASYSATRIIGPLVAGVLVAFMPIADLMVFDALSFVLSAISLALITRSFNSSKHRKSTHIRQDVVEGLRYVLTHPVLRNISIMMALVNFFGSTVQSQMIYFSKEALSATDTQVSLLYSASGAGAILLALLAGRLRRRWAFSRVALGSLLLTGVLTIALAFTSYFWVAVPIWALMSGLGTLFNINTGSLRQAIVPNEMLGRVISVAGVLAWSAIPLGAILGGWAIERTGDVVTVFAVIGIIRVLIPIVFSFTPLGHAEDYLPRKEEAADVAA